MRMTMEELMALMPREQKFAEIVEASKDSVVIRVVCPCCGEIFELVSERNIPRKD